MTLRPFDPSASEIELAEALAELERESRNYLARFRAVPTHPSSASGPVLPNSQSPYSGTRRPQFPTNPQTTHSKPNSLKRLDFRPEATQVLQAKKARERAARHYQQRRRLSSPVPFDASIFSAPVSAKERILRTPMLVFIGAVGLAMSSGIVGGLIQTKWPSTMNQVKEGLVMLVFVIGLGISAGILSVPIENKWPSTREVRLGRFRSYLPEHTAIASLFWIPIYGYIWVFVGNYLK